MKMLKTEKKIWNYIEERKETVAVIFFFLIGLIIRYFFRDHESVDYDACLNAWFNEIKDGGGFRGIASYTGNYNYAYVFILAVLTYLPVKPLYSIKLVSVIFDAAAAIVAGAIGERINLGEKKVFVGVFGFVFLSPVVMVNSALWGQCDSIYTTFILLAILMLLKDKYVLSFIMLGVSFAFKLQAIFIFPLFFFLYFVNKKFSILHFLLIPVGTFIASIPGMIFSGKGIDGFINTYINQAGDSEVLSNNFPNIYYWISGAHYELFNKVGIVFTVAIILLVFFIIYGKRVTIAEDKIVSMALWTILCCVYFLPNMHERYGYVAEILCIIWAVGNNKWIWYPILMSSIIFFCYMTVLFRYDLYYFQNMGAVNIIAFVFFTIHILMDICHSEVAKE